MIQILSLFSMNRTSLSISEIQAELGYPKSTVFRILSTLEKYNYVKKNPDNHRYSLGFQFFRLGSIVQSEFDFRQAALPIMKQLVDETNETVELNIVDGSSRICIEKVDSPLDVRNFVRIGERKPLYLGASGKVLLAFLSKNEQEKVFEELRSNDIDIDKLKKELEDIRKNGYKVTKAERVAGSFAIACPIFDYTGEMVAGLTIAGPIQRLTKEHETLLIKKLIVAAKKISEELGYFNGENRLVTD